MLTYFFKGDLVPFIESSMEVALLWGRDGCNKGIGTELSVRKMVS